MIFLITYETNNPFQNYSGLRGAIKSADNWWHHIKNTWIIRTNESVDYWYDTLSIHLYDNDRIFIVEIKPNYQGRLNKEAWDWLKRQFGKKYFLKKKKFLK